MSEKWKWVEGFEGYYQVSSHGRVRSVDRIIDHPQGPARIKGKTLRPKVNVQGYHRAALCREGEMEAVMIHRLVLGAFVGPCLGGHECNHKDGDKANNRLENLEWVTRSENTLHAFANGLKTPTRGEGNPYAKLTWAKVEQIQTLYAMGAHTQDEIGEMFGVSQATIGRVVRGESWAVLADHA